jgi:hypothetical protein
VAGYYGLGDSRRSGHQHRVDGIAEVELTAGPLGGAATVTAALAGGSPSVVFHLTVVPP